MKKKAKIGIDALGINEKGGGRTSILGYLQILTSEATQWQFIIYLSAVEPSLQKPNVKQVILPFGRGILARLFMQLYLPLDVIFRNIKIIHFTKGQASLVFTAKMILTIHDITIILHPDIHSRSSVFYWKNIQPWMLKMMDAIITVSENTAKDLIEYLKVKPEKITIVYNSTQFYNFQEEGSVKPEEIMNKYALGTHYLLYVGLLALKKNLETLIRAIILLRDYFDSIPPLVLVGPRYSDSDAGYILNLIEELGLENQIKYLGKIPRNDLYYIYKNADLFLFPSIHEGFGIPCLEAMDLGVPVIASNNSAITEIVGEAGVLIDDYNSPQSWADTIKKLYENESWRIKLIQQAQNRAQTIKSKYSIHEAIEVYDRLLKRQRK